MSDLTVGKYARHGSVFFNSFVQRSSLAQSSEKLIVRTNMMIKFKFWCAGRTLRKLILQYSMIAVGWR